MTASSPTNEPGGPSTVDDQPSPKRWGILFLLFLSIMINLIDRQVLSVMAPVIRDELGLTNADYSQILFAFLLGLTLFQYPAGWMIDRKGARFGLPLIMFVWSVANGLHAIARNLWHLTDLFASSWERVSAEITREASKSSHSGSRSKSERLRAAYSTAVRWPGLFSLPC